MRKRSENLVRDVSKALLDAAVLADDVVTKASGVFRIMRPRDAGAQTTKTKSTPAERDSWDMRTIPPPAPLPQIALMDDPPPSSTRSPSAYPSPLGVLKNTFDPRIPYATKKQYAGALPWVQPSPHIPDGLAATVLNVPDDEVREFMDVVVNRYLRTLHGYWVKAAAYAIANVGANEVPDRELVRILTDTPMSKFLCSTLDPRDRAMFRGLIDDEKLARGGYVKVDFSNTRRLAPRDGIYVANTVTLLERTAHGFAPCAIGIDGLVVQPVNTNAWELSKYFVLQGAANALVVGQHPMVHFPMDAVNAITKTALPETHPVRQLLAPHCYMQLPLNYAVLYIDKSIIVNDQREIYTCLTGRGDAAWRYTSEYYRGLDGNSPFPGFRYGLEAPRTPSPYGDFLRAYFDVILDFTRAATSGVRSGDGHVRAWANHLAAVVTGFPDGREIFEGDTLARALAYFIWDVSVQHTADHHAFAEESVNTLLFRLRVPPPTSLVIPKVDRTRLVRKEDVFRHRMARVMYFKPTVLRRLIDVEYAFDDAPRRDAAAAFLRGLRDVDDDATLRRHCPLECIAASIQF